MHQLFEPLLKRALDQDKSKVAILCADKEMCEAMRRRLHEMAAGKMAVLTAPSIPAIYLNWLVVRFFPYSERENLSYYGFDECEVIEGPKIRLPITETFYTAAMKRSAELQKFDGEGFYRA